MRSLLRLKEGLVQFSGDESTMRHITSEDTADEEESEESEESEDEDEIEECDEDAEGGEADEIEECDEDAEGDDEEDTFFTCNDPDVAEMDKRKPRKRFKRAAK